MAKIAGRSAFILRTTPGGQFLAELGQERRNGNLSPEVEQRLKLAFRALGWDASDATLATAIGSEIERGERDAAVLKKLRSELFGAN
nr:hypothetical protein [uncultured Rhodopila sp.]